MDAGGQQALMKTFAGVAGVSAIVTGTLGLGLVAGVFWALGDESLFSAAPQTPAAG